MAGQSRRKIPRGHKLKNGMPRCFLLWAPCIIQAEYGSFGIEVTLVIQEPSTLQFFCGFSKFKDEPGFGASYDLSFSAPKRCRLLLAFIFVSTPVPHRVNSFRATVTASHTDLKHHKNWFFRILLPVLHFVLYPFGFFVCQFQLSQHIASKSSVVCQPSSRFAKDASAYASAISPDLRGNIS